MDPNTRLIMDRAKVNIRQRLMTVVTDYNSQVRPQFPQLTDEQYNLCVKELIDEGHLFACYGRRKALLLRLAGTQETR